MKRGEVRWYEFSPPDKRRPGFCLLNALNAQQVGGFLNPVYFTATGMIGMIALAGIVTRDSIIPYLNELTIAPITSTIRGIPSELVLGVEAGMPQECAVNFDHLQTVSKTKLGQLITVLPAEVQRQVGPALCFALGLDEYLEP